MSSAAGAHYYSFSGEPYAEEVLSMENPVLSASTRAGVVYDAGGQSLFVFRGKSKRSLTCRWRETRPAVRPGQRQRLAGGHRPAERLQGGGHRLRRRRKRRSSRSACPPPLWWTPPCPPTAGPWPW
ncbi:MAG: hypothetical protein V8S34_00350 [Lawsonibacter sp.]